MTVQLGQVYAATMDVSKIARQLGKLGGLVKSKTKAKAARENGKLGGRPKARSQPKNK